MKALIRSGVLLVVCSGSFWLGSFVIFLENRELPRFISSGDAAQSGRGDIPPTRIHDNTDTFSSSGNATQSRRGGIPPTDIDIGRRGDKILLFVPGIGCNDITRLTAVQNNIHRLDRHSTVHLDCLIHSFVQREALLPHSSGLSLQKFAEFEQRCTFEYLPGAHYADMIKSIHPMMFSRSGYDYLLVVLDDVELSPSFDLDRFVQIAGEFRLDVSSPLVSNGRESAPSTRKDGRNFSSKKHGFYCESVEVFATLFTPRGWRCYWEAVDPVRLSKGWLSSLLIYDICKPYYPDFLMGVLVHMWSTHGIKGSTGSCIPLRYYNDTRRSPGLEQAQLSNVTVRNINFSDYVTQYQLLNSLGKKKGFFR